MRRTIDDWFTVVDARGRFTWLVGLVLAAGVSFIEIGGAAIVAVALQLSTAPADAEVTLPIIGDVESFLPGDDRVDDLRWLALAGSLFFVFRGAAVLLQQYVTFRATFSLAVRLCDSLTDRLLGRNYRWHLSQNSADLAGTAVVLSQTFAVGVFAPVQALAAQSLVVFALSAVVIVIEPIGALGSVVVIGGVIWLILRVTRRRLVALGQQEVDEVVRAQRLSTEAFRAVREVKIHDLGASVRAQIWDARTKWSRAMRIKQTMVAAPRTIIETAAFSLLIVLVAYRTQGDSDTALAGIGVLGYAVIRILPSANNMVTHLNTARGSQASMGQIADLLRQPEDTEDEVTPVRTPRTESLLPLRANGVRFAYEPGTEVLTDVDVEVPEGSSIGLVGPTGCGKSTLFDVLIGLLPPSAGEVTLGGVELRARRAEWWGAIGVVPQTVTLLDASLRENVALGATRTTATIEPADPEEALARAIRLAQLEEVVAELPDGVETMIGEGGVRLSGGQQQRLAIARALFRDPSVLFLDEGTSALDADTERSVIEALRTDRPDRTLVMIAHRVSTLRDCDEILVFDQGRVASRGTYDDLLVASEQFQRLASLPEATR